MNKKQSFILNSLGKAILVLGGTVAGVVLFYTFAALPLHSATQRAKERNLLMEQKTDLAKLKTEKKTEIGEELNKAIQRVAILESTFPQGDPYLWILRKLQRFESDFNVHVTHVGPPKSEKLEGYPKLPYQSIVYLVTGSAYYEDFGQFLEELENTLPFLNITSLDLEPANVTGAEVEPSELLIFKLELSAITKATQN